MRRFEGRVGELFALSKVFWLFIVISSIQEANFWWIGFWKIGRVLRIRKAPRNDNLVIETQNQVKKDAKPVLSEDESKLWREWPSMATATTSAALAHVYAYEIIQPLLGKNCVDAGVNDLNAFFYI